MLVSGRVKNPEISQESKTLTCPSKKYHPNHSFWTDLLVEVNAPIDGRDIDLVQQTFARVAMLGSNTIGRLLFMNIFKSLGKTPETLLPRGLEKRKMSNTLSFFF